MFSPPITFTTEEEVLTGDYLFVASWICASQCLHDTIHFTLHYNTCFLVILAYYYSYYSSSLLFTKDVAI
jgi:uncharacterized membrane protein